MWNELRAGLAAALGEAGLDSTRGLDRLELTIPRERSHGDWSTNLAMGLAKAAKRPPRELAAELAAAFPLAGSPFAAVEVAGPGFLNFRYRDDWLAALPARIVAEAGAFGHSSAGAGEQVLVEYVSANPTGPMNIVSARAAAVGSALVRLLDAAGFAAASEFYVNDAGNQVELLGESLAARFAERIGESRPLPEEGYRGEYVRELAAKLPEAEARAALARRDGGGWFAEQALARVVDWQREDLAAYGVRFDRWFRESSLHPGAVERALAALEARGVTYRAERPEGVTEAAETRVKTDAGAAAGGGVATWLRTSQFGDAMDRVIVRSDGRPTYLLPDIAYHLDKRARGFRRAINLWGPDHHAYVTTLTAGLKALGLEDDFLHILIVQQVNLLRDGTVVKMSKRAGEFDTLRDLVDEVGADCAKFFFLMRGTSSHLDFDLGLAKRQNDENPAFYVQYAHARIASVLRKGAEAGLAPATGDPAPLAHPAEVALVRQLATWPEVVRGAAHAREPHRVPAFLVETAAEFHRFYQACRVVSEDAAQSRHRLRLCAGAAQVLRNGLGLLGVSAPERLERTTEASA
ncbi:MAG TPA: arginine--tRNA ligase [Candidatus Eisenbacteria bacterium]